jgi:hypothetical protein
VLFDLSDIRALQEDVDKLHERARKNGQAGYWSFEEVREATGKDPNIKSGTFFIPSSSIATPIEEMGKRAERLAGPGEDGAEATEPVGNLLDEVRHDCGRLVARDVVGNPELHCDKCMENFRPHVELIIS